MACLPIVGITIGDPAGIGPEITLKALATATVRSLCIPVVLGDAGVLGEAEAFTRSGLVLRVISETGDARNEPGILNLLDFRNVEVSALRLGVVDEACGRAMIEYLERGLELWRAGKIHGLVLGPHNKEAVNRAGIPFDGYPAQVAKLTGCRYAFIMLVAGDLRCVNATLHVPLREVPHLLTHELIEAAIRSTAEIMRRFGVPCPRVGVAGLNPHGGEGGIFGDEEERVIRPAIDAARRGGLDVDGPIPGDSLFTPSRRKQYDVIVCMYHDQGHIAIKALRFEEIVGWIIGTPVLVATVGHGSAFDIAGRGVADPTSLKTAICQVARAARVGG